MRKTQLSIVVVVIMAVFVHSFGHPVPKKLLLIN